MSRLETRIKEKRMGSPLSELAKSRQGPARRLCIQTRHWLPHTELTLPRRLQQMCCHSPALS